MRLIFTDSAQQSGFKDIQVLKATTIYDHRYGEVKITPEMLTQMVKNFDEKTRGVEIMLDAGHNSDKEAYGWFKSLYTKNGDDDKLELWAKVELTSLGQKALTEKLYGYISADFDMNYQDNETLLNHGCVLLGAGLTNRPVIKKMTPAIELSENGENKMMTVEELLASCGVGSPEELIKMIGDLKGSIEASSAKEKEMQEKIEMSEKTSKFNNLMSEGKAVEAQRDAFFKNDMIEFAKNAQPVKLSEISTSDEVEEKNAEDQILELAEKKVKEEKITMARAIEFVLSENPELNKQYRKIGE
jgi:hypothetical protein